MGAGSHTSRVVRSVSRVAESFGYEVYFTIFQKNMTMTMQEIGGSDSITMVRAAKHMALNFRVVSELSTLSWEVHDNHLTAEQMRERYNKIMEKPRLSRWLVLFLVACANASFCRLFEGDFVGMGWVFSSTLVAFFVRQEMMNRHMNHYIIFVISAFISSSIAGIGVHYQLGNTPDIALATSVLFLIPGVPLINAIMDMLEGHVLTGISRFVNASILIISISIGFLITLLTLGLEKL